MTAVTAESLSWQERAACRDIDPELFFPVGDADAAATLRQTAEAKKVCATCPVRAACREYALATFQKEGIWGGLTEHELHLERRRARRRTA
jgi:WhiB family transcriptional regulator, redox-sensing transcriptional regulator